MRRVMKGVFVSGVSLFNVTLHASGIADGERIEGRNQVDVLMANDTRECSSPRPHSTDEEDSCNDKTCVFELMYRLDVHFEQKVQAYSYERLQHCLKSLTGLQGFKDEVDIDVALELESQYFRPEFKQLHGYNPELTHRAAFEARGLVRDSLAPKFMKQVNRLPFVEHYLRTGIPWSTSAPQSALQLLHLIVVTLPNLGLPNVSDMTRVADAGCGTGFIAATLALICTRCTEVVCLEYEQSLNNIGKQIAEHGGIYDPQTLPEDSDEQTVLRKISWRWGDALTMQDLSEGANLGKFNLILFSMSIPHGDLPEALANALEENGVLVGPQCESPDVGEYRQHTAKNQYDHQTAYCVGRWRIFQKRNSIIKEVQMDYIIPSFFMVPTPAVVRTSSIWSSIRSWLYMLVSPLMMVIRSLYDHE